MTSLEPADLARAESRISKFCSRAPRTWSEIVSMLAGANADRDDLPEEDAAKVLTMAHVLWTMTREGRMQRQAAADPCEDTYVPTGARS